MGIRYLMAFIKKPLSLITLRSSDTYKTSHAPCIYLRFKSTNNTV